MLSCREVAANADAIIQGEGPWHRRLSVRVHLLMCEHCRRFIAQYRRVTRLVTQVEAPASDDGVMTGLDAARQTSRSDSRDP
jgi:anti-sigma factor ChrR (cupin superfamily)